jgi:hypothetical protein
MKEEYVLLRNSIFNSINEGEQPKIPIDFFYRYYVQNFDKLPKTKKLPKTDMMGNVIFNEFGEMVWKEINVELIPPGIFAQYFGTFISMSFNDILEELDKKFEVNWLCDKTGKKIKIVL